VPDDGLRLVHPAGDLLRGRAQLLAFLSFYGTHSSADLLED
jgi:hypothetical protein